MPAGLKTPELVAALERMAAACQAVGDAHGAQLASESAARLAELLDLARDVARLEDLSRVWDGWKLVPGPIYPAPRASLIDRSRIFLIAEASRGADRGVERQVEEADGVRVVRFIPSQTKGRAAG